MIQNPTHALVLGTTNLIGLDSDIAAQGYKLDAMGTDADWGNGLPVEDKITSWLQDGAIVGLQGYDNRDLFIRVRITAADDAGLAAGEFALMLETGKRNQLVWTPPGVGPAASVFDIAMSHLEQVTDDVAELRYQRTYGIRIQAAPFVRSQELATVAVPAPSVEEQTSSLVDDCNSTTDWAFITTPPAGPAVSVTPPVLSGRLFAFKENLAMSGMTRLALRRVDLGTDITDERYFRVDLAITAYQANVVPDLLDGSPVAFFIDGYPSVPLLQDGNVYWFDAAAGIFGGGTISTFEVQVGFTTYTSSSQAYFSIGDIQQSNVLGDVGTNRELFRTLPVAGSARTQGNLTLADESNALGSTLVYTCPVVPNLIQPPLRARLLAGPTETLDEDTISGSYSDLETEHIFEVQASGLIPGAHLLLVRLNGAEGGGDYPPERVAIEWSAYSRQGSTDLGDPQSGTSTVELPIGYGWQIVPVASMNLPPRKVGPDGVVRITLQTTYEGVLSGIAIDEAWLFNTDVGRLTWVEAGGANRLWLDAATLDTPVPTIWLGDDADRSDSFHAASEIRSFGNHEFTPPAISAFTASEANQVALGLSHFPRFHTHVTSEPVAPPPDPPREGLMQVTSNAGDLDGGWIYPDDAQDGDALFAFGMIADGESLAGYLDAGWTLSLDIDPISVFLDGSVPVIGGETLTYRTVLLTKFYDGDTTMPPVEAADTGKHLLIAGCWAGLDPSAEVNVGGLGQTIGTEVQGSGLPDYPLNFFGYMAPLYDFDGGFTLASCASETVVELPDGQPALAQLTTSLPDDVPRAMQPIDDFADHDIVWWAVYLGWLE